jgi:hypothetical protein
VDDTGDIPRKGEEVVMFVFQLVICIKNFRFLRTKFCGGYLELKGRKTRKSHNEELHNLHSSPNIVRVIKSRRMRWAGHVARMGEGRGVYRVLVRIARRRRDHWEDLGVGGSITLRWT